MKSVVSYPDRGEGGNNQYRGNCSPKLIEDIIAQYGVRNLSDYMVGSGTTEDVCNRLGVPGTFLDLNRGFDMMSMDIPDRPGNVFWHPPYESIVTYSDVMYSASEIMKQYGFDPKVNDLSRCKNWEDFVRKMNYCCLKQFTAMEKGGRMFILMGDIKKRGRLYSMLLDIAKPGTVEQIIIKTQHNCVSDRCSYSGKFVPIAHEYLLVLRKDAPLIFDVSMNRTVTCDVRGARQTGHGKRKSGKRCKSMPASAQRSVECGQWLPPKKDYYRRKLLCLQRSCNHAPARFMLTAETLTIVAHTSRWSSPMMGNSVSAVLLAPHREETAIAADSAMTKSFPADPQRYGQKR